MAHFPLLFRRKHIPVIVVRAITRTASQWPYKRPAVVAVVVVGVVVVVVVEAWRLELTRRSP